MKVLLISRHLDRPTAWVAQQLREQGLRLEIMCRTDTINYQALQAAGIPLSTAPFRHRLDLLSARLVRAKLKEGGFDILHACETRALAAGLWASYGLGPKIIAYRGSIAAVSSWDPSSYLTLLHPRVAKVICVSEAVRQSLSESLPAEKLVTIYKGHDPDWYGPFPPASLAEFKIPSDAFIISCTANARPHKGVQFLFQAMHWLNNPRVHLIFIGHGADSRLLRQAREGPAKGRIHLAGFRKNAHALVGRSHCFVMPSLREGLPKAVIEAMSQGVPPIVSNVGGLPELVRHEECGLVVSAQEATALAAAIARLVVDEELRERLGRAARQRIMEDFHVSRMCSETLALYKSVLGCDHDKAPLAEVA